MPLVDRPRRHDGKLTREGLILKEQAQPDFPTTFTHQSREPAYTRRVDISQLTLKPWRSTEDHVKEHISLPS